MPPRTSARNRAAAAARAEVKKVAEEPTAKVKATKPVNKTKTEPAPAASSSKTKKKTTGATPSRKRKAVEESHDEEEHECDSHDEAEDKEDEDEEVKEEKKESKKPAPKKRKTKDEDMAPLAERTALSSLKKAMFVGAHVSAAGGVQNSITNAAQIGANAFALFLKSQRKWTAPALDPAARDAFRAAAEDAPYAAGEHVLPHGSYLVNLAQADRAKADQAYGNFVDDLRRCAALGVRLYNFHPGSTGGAPMADATARIAAQLNRAHRETAAGGSPGVVTVLENMCGHGNIIGGRFEDLRDVIAAVDDQTRVGVCLDTCHAFAAGYDMRTPDAFAATMAEFDRVVGLRYLRALHLNDSKAPLGSHRDLHANIGTGFLGLRAFHCVMNYDGFQNMPLVLETPIDRKGPDGKTVEDKKVWADEIKLLEWLIGADPESDEFKEKEKALSAQGEDERKRIQQQVDAKTVKDAKKDAKKGAKKATRKGKKKVTSDDEDDE